MAVPAFDDAPALLCQVNGVFAADNGILNHFFLLVDFIFIVGGQYDAMCERCATDDEQKQPAYDENRALRCRERSGASEHVPDDMNQEIDAKGEQQDEGYGCHPKHKRVVSILQEFKPLEFGTERIDKYVAAIADKTEDDDAEYKQEEQQYAD